MPYTWQMSNNPTTWQSGYMPYGDVIRQMNQQGQGGMYPQGQPAQGYQPNMPNAGGVSNPGMGFYQQGYQNQQYDPYTFSQMVAPSYLSGQQATQQQEMLKQRMEAGKELASSLGLGDLVKFTDDSDIQTGLENIPIQETLQESKRNIENRYARGGTALSSEYGRDVGQAEGAAMNAIRMSKTLADMEQKQNYLTAYLRAMGSYLGG